MPYLYGVYPGSGGRQSMSPNLAQGCCDREKPDEECGVGG
ncbi:unnamed protein product [Ectocarpus sp. CCAP 1310/34]|nr:unnamed protein product [Ectocarpus sp. CCAP 1310/34]